MKPQISNLKPQSPSSLLMEDLRKPLIFFLISLQISCFFFNLSWAFSPLDNHLIDCGSDVNTIIDNRKFISDLSNTGSISFSAIQTNSLKDQNPSLGSSSIYHTARVFTRSSSYEFEIKETGFHLVRLHFLPFASSKYNLSDALFHVSVPGFLLLSNFSGRNAVLKEYLIWVDSEKFAISFTPAKKSSFAFTNAIEVISAPRDLIADTARFVNSEGVKDINGLMKQSLETVYRVNIGGLKVTPFNDTLWRTWIPDDGFLKLSASSKKVSYGGRIKYQMGGASREVAPDNVYNSARVMANPSVSVPEFNMTWVFPVRLGYRYLVRMHFCDIASLALNELYFDVYINGYSAYKDLDLSALTGQMLASPFYADFVVDGDKSGELSISIGPSSLSSPARINAILNGLEIMKMSNSKGSLDGQLSVDCIMKNSPEANGGILVPSVAVMSLLFAALVVMHKKRTEVREYMGWSLLPVDEKPR